MNSQKLTHYKKLIDAEVATYSTKLLAHTSREYGTYSAAETEIFLNILQRGGKRLRGALVMAGYEMRGGTDQQMILQAAVAIEMIHTYLLITDDIADRSALRRGGPAAHVQFEEYHRTEQLKGDQAHFGQSMAMTVALLGIHLAELKLEELAVAPGLKIKALQRLHTNLVHTIHGQLRDVLNECLLAPTEKDALGVAILKTAYYTFVNPLEMGIILAGGKKSELSVIRQYGVHAGVAFQLADDIIGIFSDETTSGKSASDDLREGKVTLLMQHALTRATPEQKKVLRAALGNPRLTHDDVVSCRNILTENGALKEVQAIANSYSQQAITALAKAPGVWQENYVDFLRELAEYVVNRQK
jgi:geranylgeranyl diphosphate synthase type I